MNNETPETITPLGLSLHNARLAASLSVEEVAARLNLGEATVNDLEGDITVLIDSGKYSPIYLRGYLSNYAKIVDLKALSEFPEYQLLVKNQKPQGNFRATANTAAPLKKKKKKSRPSGFLVFLLLAAIALVIANQLGFLSRGQSVSIEAEPISENILNQGNKPFNPLLNHTETLPAAEEVISDGVAQDETLELSGNVDQQVTPLVVNEAIDKTQLNAADAGEVAEPAETTEVTDATAAANSADLVDEPAPAPQTAANGQSLTVSFSKDCWTEITDAKGKRLAYGLYKAGGALALEGVAPFTVKLGDPSGVTINYQGKKLERTFAPGRPAKFTIQG
ncbi:MAG: RodZ domain-containing protein [Psychromonas sp.]